MSNLSTEQLTQALKQLVEQQDLVWNGNMFVLQPSGVVLLHGGITPVQFPVKVGDAKCLPQLVAQPSLFLSKDWTLNFMNFIAEAKVPRQLDDGKGGIYTPNKYSEPAKKIFQKAIEKEGVIYDILVKSTMLYYKSNNRYKKNIGNYFIQGDWRTDYNNLLEAAGDGTVEQHIKSQIDYGTKSHYELG